MELPEFLLITVEFCLLQDERAADAAKEKAAGPHVDRHNLIDLIHPFMNTMNLVKTTAAAMCQRIAEYLKRE